MAPHDPTKISTICIFGHNPLSLALLTSLSTSALDLNLHFVHTSSYELDLPGLPRTRVTQHRLQLSALRKPEELTKALASLSADLLISTAHGGDYAFQKTLISACVGAGIRRFMPAEFGHDSLNPAVQELLPPYIERAKIINPLTESRIEWIGLATGCDIGRRLLDGNMGIDLAWQSATVYGTGGEKFTASSSAFLGKVVGSLASRWDEYRHRYLCVSEMEVSYRQILDVLEREMGCRFTVGYLEQEEGVNEARRRIETGWPDAGMFLLERSVLADEKCFERFSTQVMSELSVERESLDTIVRRVVHEFKHHGKGGCGCS